MENASIMAMGQYERRGKDDDLDETEKFEAFYVYLERGKIVECEKLFSRISRYGNIFGPKILNQKEKSAFSFSLNRPLNVTPFKCTLKAISALSRKVYFGNMPSIRGPLREERACNQRISVRRKKLKIKCLIF